MNSESFYNMAKVFYLSIGSIVKIGYIIKFGGKTLIIHYRFFTHYGNVFYIQNTCFFILEFPLGLSAVGPHSCKPRVKITACPFNVLWDTPRNKKTSAAAEKRTNERRGLQAMDFARFWTFSFLIWTLTLNWKYDSYFYPLFSFPWWFR